MGDSVPRAPASGPSKPILNIVSELQRRAPFSALHANDTRYPSGQHVGYDERFIVRANHPTRPLTHTSGRATLPHQHAAPSRPSNSPRPPNSPRPLATERQP